MNRPEGSATLFLTFRGTREQKVRDTGTRIRIPLQGAQAARLRRLLSERLTDQEKAKANQGPLQLRWSAVATIWRLFSISRTNGDHVELLRKINAADALSNASIDWTSPIWPITRTAG